MSLLFIFFFFFNDTATTEIYTLSLHDALPICRFFWVGVIFVVDYNAIIPLQSFVVVIGSKTFSDRKSTRLNSSHSQISYAVFCLKKKKKTKINTYIIHINKKRNRSRAKILALQ